MLNGYQGRILRVDLSSGDVRSEPLSERDALDFVGGSGLAGAYLFRETGPETDPLGPANRLIFMTGPLTGTKVPLSGRHAVVTRSPLTGIWGEADIGGTWGQALKRAGYDGIVVQGQARSPVYLYVDETTAEVRDASPLWGRDTWEVDELLREALGDDVKIHSIGPAGERLVRFAAILSDGREGRAAARCGVGAVMGSKRLKAIAVRGARPVELAHPDRVNVLVKQMAGPIRKNAGGMHDYGTLGGMVTIEAVGDLPLKNWQAGSWPEGAEELSGQELAKRYLRRRYYCGACVIGCGRVVEVPGGKYGAVPLSAGPEYETGALLGANLLIADLEAVQKANELCNRYGLDTISTGAVIAFAFEAYERGWIGERETGRPLRWVG